MRDSTLERRLTSCSCQILPFHSASFLRRRRSNNNVSDWKEFERLKELPNLRDLLLVNTPLYNSIATDADDSEWRLEVLKRLPNLKKLDGKDVTDDELEAAMAA